MKKQDNSYKIVLTLVTIAMFLGSLFIFSIKSLAAEVDLLTPLRSMAAATGNKLLVVSKDEKPGAYNNIVSAVNDAADGDMIVIFPGEYNETLDIRDKDIILMGLDKDSCIIKYDTSVYSKPVLNGASGLFCNLTFYGYRPKNAALSNDSTGAFICPDNLDEYFPGYVIHIDDDYEYGRSIVFNNCNIISENNNCIGLGMRDHFSASFNNCYIRSVGIAGILYVHDPDSFMYAGTDMHLSFKNNVWENYGYPYVIFTKSINCTNRIEVTFQNVTTYCYASAMNGNYTFGNAYNGPDLKMVAAGLAPCTTPFYVMDNADYGECIKALRSGSASGFPGIYYITDVAKNDVNFLPEIASPIYVHNPYNIPGTGFAGSNTLHLTNDSFGNTLEEMNFIR